MIDSGRLLADTRSLVRALVDDLRTNADAETVKEEYAAAKAAGRTALPQPQWAEGLYAQVAVSWVLGVVFVRFCEDNGLVADALISGPGNRRQLARDQRAAYLHDHPAQDDRDWLRHVFSHYRELPATGDVFGDHNPLWLLEPSADGARELLGLFQRIDPDTGEITHDFTDPAWSTRFLGDLYQDLSDHAKKQFALLQTPEFVEEFILDRTLEPAIATFGLADTTLIDPTCGSGHFLLGAFHRLVARWADAEPSTNPRERVRRALAAVAGVDVNPFAVAIARFRLLVAAMKAAGDQRLRDAPTYPLNVAVGDSLLHGATTGELDVHNEISAARHGYATEDLELASDLLSQEYAAVVGNPPYIVAQDPALNQLYRTRYKSCRGKYSLGIPFTERFWQLARSSPTDRERAGYIGLITTNAFMKRESGKNLIEKWLPQHDLTHMIDTSGAYIPGHGTPTVILFGRSRSPVSADIRAVLGIRGEPSTPAEPAKGLVWTSITEQLDQTGSQTEFVSVVDMERQRLHHHPWSIGGGGAAELKERLDGAGAAKLGTRADSIGITSFTLEDDAFLLDARGAARDGVSPTRPMVEGERIRDWGLGACALATFPYDADLRPIGDALAPPTARHLWPRKTLLENNKMFGGVTKVDSGLHWTEFGRLTTGKLRTPLSIAFAFVATHNHFVLDRGGKVFNRSAPVIKLPEGASEAAHLELLGVLNSSTACFWMKQVFHNKGSTVDTQGARQTTDAFENFYEFDGTKLQAFPLPRSLPLHTAAALDHDAQKLSAASPATVARDEVPTPARLADAGEQYHHTLARMIGLQEQLDWEVYRLYGLVDDDLTLPGGEPPLALGERAFEIVLARKVAAGEESTTWFARHRSTPITELPAHWSPEYRALVERRIAVIESNPEIALIERPEYKRRWNTVPWEEQQAAALKDWLLDRLESAEYWSSGQVLSTAQLADRVRSDGDFMTVARLFAGRDDVDVGPLVAELVKAEAVPYLAALRHTESGLRKRAEWEHTWALQRREDAGEDVGDIPVPPKYTKADFTGVAWTHRGKLDVPKERFVSYPGAERTNDPSLVVGWAGWDHLQRARALATHYLAAKGAGRDAEQLTPLLAGLAELVPWLLQWYDEPNADPALDRPGSQIKALVDSELRTLQLTATDLLAWRPAAPARGRRRST
ncbi:BREX-2 system adenine-specific DNA-methyltransferase PglX [Desertimonas flava]|uniref:BREX-2 system adenine-specific DNA-methyltransferase PglX n=1 Tax=Desertimonas flava TaxID=2064846 RepID=UPI000E346D0B|nr:BREX-2 system adenine-specific DNA-methyltransferase PglX [Desertimonas flava]